jgi:hypothetical protein
VEVLNIRIINDVPHFVSQKVRIQNLDNINGRYDTLINVHKDGEWTFVKIFSMALLLGHLLV